MTPDTPATPRPAATVALLRPRSSGASGGEPGIEVLLLRRAPSSGFVPENYVFPGGTVDRDDAAPALLERFEGLGNDRATERMELADADPPAVAFWVAAVRETFEETGLLLGRTKEGGAPATAFRDPAVEKMRRRVLDDEDLFPDVLDRMGCRMAGDLLEYAAHWITPVGLPRRYDTRFFVGVAPPGSRVVIDEREMTEALWLTPDAAIRGHREERLPMILPTVRTLESLRGFPSPEAVLAHFANRRVPTILPRIERDEEGGTKVVEEVLR